MASINNPTANAFSWEVSRNENTYELSLFANEIFPEEEVGLRTVYRKKGESEWLYLIEESIRVEDDFSNKFSIAIASISKKVRNFFLLDEDDTSVPETLFEKVDIAIRDQVSWDESKKELVRK